MIKPAVARHSASCEPGGRELDFQSQGTGIEHEPHKVLEANLSLPDEWTNRETGRKITFYSIHLVSDMA